MSASKRERALRYFEGCPAGDRVWLMEEYTWNWPIKRVGVGFSVLRLLADQFDDDDGVMGFLSAYGDRDLRVDPSAHKYAVDDGKRLRGLDDIGLADLCMEVLGKDPAFLEAVSEGDVQSEMPPGLRRALAAGGKAREGKAAPKRRARNRGRLTKTIREYGERMTIETVRRINIGRLGCPFCGSRLPYLEIGNIEETASTGLSGSCDWQCPECGREGMARWDAEFTHVDLVGEDWETVWECMADRRARSDNIKARDARKAPAKRSAAAKEAPAKKAEARKAAPPKRPVPARKPAATRMPARRIPAKAAPVMARRTPIRYDGSWRALGR